MAKILFQVAWFELGILVVIHQFPESLKPPSEATGVWSSSEVLVLVPHSPSGSWDCWERPRSVGLAFAIPGRLAS